MKLVTYNLKLKNKIQATCFKLRDCSGYAAMFSFLVMIIILGSLISVFTILVFKSIFLARTSIIEFKNIYAAEGLAEDTIKRARDNDLPDTLSGETLEAGEAAVTATLSSESTIKTYSFSTQIGNRYFGSETLVIDGAGASAKIKKWQDTQ